METQALFENIAESLQQEIRKAERTIFIAVAWFTNKNIFDELVTKANEGCIVNLMLSNDPINKDSSIEFDKLNVSNSKVYFVGDGEKELMHNKFCVIDRNIVITGSYNWSYKAEKNFENIVITYDDTSLAEQFIIEFNNIRKRYYPEFETTNLDFPLHKIIKRLEILKNYIILEDVEEFQKETTKLKEYAFNSDLEEIIGFARSGEWAEAIGRIEKFISRNQQITTWTDPEIAALKLEIKILENQLVSFDNEKSELERVLSEFQRRHTMELGETILEILKIRKILFKEDQDKFEEAEQDEKDYKEQFDQEKEKEIFELSEEDNAELKKKYRKAMLLCHPDKFANESLEIQKEAEAISKELIEAKDKKDLNRVSEILENLQKGILNTSKGDMITDKERLRASVNRLRTKIRDLENIIFGYKQSEEYTTISQIQDWDEYFQQLKVRLSNELEALKHEML
jgi:hypothetical protein